MAKKTAASTAETKKTTTKKVEPKEVKEIKKIGPVEVEVPPTEEYVEPLCEAYSSAENMPKLEEFEAEQPMTVEEAIEAVDLEIPDTEEENIEEKIEEAMAPIEEVVNEVKEIEERRPKVEQEVLNKPEKAEEILKEELKKAEAIKAKVDKIINTKKPNNQNITSWWNGMGYDF